MSGRRCNLSATSIPSGGGMDFSDKQIQSLLDIAQFVYWDPTPTELCNFLATRVCPSGELAKVFIGGLEPDGIFKTVASFGYSTKSNVENYQAGLDRKIPMADAHLRAETLVYNKEEFITTYPDFQTLDKESPYEAVALVPTLGRKYVFVFRLQAPLANLHFASIYFRTIASILSLYRNEGEKQKEVEAKKPRPIESETLIRPRSELRGRALTDRQNVILGYIKDGLTNADIASILKYSESLIRQETVIIYSKLGVSGRRDILQKTSGAIAGLLAIPLVSAFFEAIITSESL